MSPDLNLRLRRNTAARAHLYGAEARRLEQQAAALQAQAVAARRRYFRELEAVDLLAGHSPSPFAPLG